MNSNDLMGAESNRLAICMDPLTTSRADYHTHPPHGCFNLLRGVDQGSRTWDFDYFLILYHRMISAQDMGLSRPGAKSVRGEDAFDLNTSCYGGTIWLQPEVKRYLLDNPARLDLATIFASSCNIITK